MSKTLLKMGVNISRLNRNIRRALPVVEDIYAKHGLECVITSTYEGNHEAGSLHYANDAFDVRRCSHDILDEIKKELGADYDVILESDHLHIEFDPK